MSEEKDPHVIASDFGFPDRSKFKTGLIPTPPERLERVSRFRTTRATIPSSVAFYPKLQMWGNDQYGDCVSAQEAFAKACCGVQISDQALIAWAGKHGLLNGAMLPDVMDLLASSPITVDGHAYGDGPYQSVDFTDESAVCAAIAQFRAPLNIAIDHSALPAGAGNQMGWYKLNLSSKYRNYDHCVGISGYGPASLMFPLYGVQVPAGVDPNKIVFGLFTWKTIGLIDISWLRAACSEMYVRNPTTTMDGAPGPAPIPVPGPTPAATVQVSVPAQVQYGDDVRVDVVAQNATALVVDGRILPATGGTFLETAAMLGDNTVTATATSADGTKVTQTAKYNVIPKVVPPPTPAPSESGVSLKTLLIVGGVTLVVGLALGILIGRETK